MKRFFSRLKKTGDKPDKPKKDKKPNKTVSKLTDKRIDKRVLIAIAVVLVAAVSVFSLNFFNQDTEVASKKDDLPGEVQEAMEDNEEVVDVLPASERLLGTNDKGYLEDPFEAPMLLIGVLQNRASNDIATVRSGNIVYNVEEGDLIAGTWKVEEIYLDRIYLSSEGREIMLGMER